MLQVSVHFKRLNRRRHILLHFSPSGGAIRQNVKEAGFIYFGAATGTLTGMHIAREHRGQGFMRLFFAYYTCFCRAFLLSATDTAHNKKTMLTERRPLQFFMFLNGWFKIAYVSLGKCLCTLPTA